MVAQRSRDTAPELALHRALHSLGFRYRVDLPIVGMPRRRADVTFTKWRTAVFVQGCFWHACPTHLHAPRHNSEWWRQKLRGNARRDEETDAHLTLIGWLPSASGNTRPSTAQSSGWRPALATRGHPRALAINTWAPVSERATEGLYRSVCGIQDTRGTGLSVVGKPPRRQHHPSGGGRRLA
ncbi:hypothetical protein [Streptomyces sp. NPDC046887]|uniref:hypothetical protein n=1 Tax=Streptomyces sp. NPDC046887 TaxID=3155472 RepID=UPI0033C3126B